MYVKRKNTFIFIQEVIENNRIQRVGYIYIEKCLLKKTKFDGFVNVSFTLLTKKKKLGVYLIIKCFDV